MKFILTSSPHILTPENTRRVMYLTLLSLLPPVAAAVYFFGFYPLILVAVSAVTCVLTELIFLICRRKDPRASLDGSALITGVLLALTLPPSFPWWAAIIGAAFAIAIGKQAFGGLGYNIFNPALLGRAFLMAAFPVQSTTWSKPITLAPDAFTGATPLALAKFSGKLTPHLSLFLGNTAGSIGETSTLLIIIGGLFLIILRYVDWRLPLSYLATVAVFGGIFWLINPTRFPQDPLFHLMSGGLMLGAFYMITDMVTSPVTKLGRVIFGAIAGILVVLIRLFGGLPEGVMYSILLANAIRPWIDRLTMPRVFGVFKKPGPPGKSEKSASNPVTKTSGNPVVSPSDSPSDRAFLRGLKKEASS
ncbi:MAG: RnfABCDGE type electron transport complex subunit D [candidate division WOR-3 bacterium]